MIAWLGDAVLGVWIAWGAPEFDALRWALIGGIIGAVLGYVARWDGERAAKKEWDEDEMWYGKGGKH